MIAVVNINYELFDNKEDEPLVECKAYRSYNVVLQVKDEADLNNKIAKLDKRLESFKRKKGAKSENTSKSN